MPPAVKAPAMNGDGGVHSIGRMAEVHVDAGRFPKSGTARRRDRGALPEVRDVSYGGSPRTARVDGDPARPKVCKVRIVRVPWIHGKGTPARPTMNIMGSPRSTQCAPNHGRRPPTFESLTERDVRGIRASEGLAGIKMSPWGF